MMATINLKYFENAMPLHRDHVKHVSAAMQLECAMAGRCCLAARGYIAQRNRHKFSVHHRYLRVDPRRVVGCSLLLTYLICKLLRTAVTACRCL